MANAKASITNSGSVYGTYHGQLLYLHEMSSWYMPALNRSLELRFAPGSRLSYNWKLNVSACVDQGLQSYLIFTGAFDRLFASARAARAIAGGIGFLPDEQGPVRSLDVGLPWSCAHIDAVSNVTAFKDGRIMNSIGQPAAVVHQFDRWCYATLHNTWLLGSEEAVAAATQRFHAVTVQRQPRISRPLSPLLSC